MHSTGEDSLDELSPNNSSTNIDTSIHAINIPEQETEMPRHAINILEQETEMPSHDINILEQGHPSTIPNAPQSKLPPLNLPRGDLLGSKESYFDICVPLYRASITGNWAAAEVILSQRSELAGFALTESYDTALHVAASAEETKQTERFVKNLVALMKEKDLELVNRSSNTAFYLAAAAGKVNMVELMLKKNPNLQTISGSLHILPLYMSVLLGKYETVKYLYKASNKMTGDIWTHENRGWMLQKCVGCDFFDVALQIVEDCPELADNPRVLRALARKPDALNGVEQTLLMRIINSVSRVLHLKVGPAEMDTDALKLLRIILRNTFIKIPKNEVDDLHGGPADSIHRTASIGERPSLDRVPSFEGIDLKTSSHVQGWPPSINQSQGHKNQPRSVDRDSSFEGIDLKTSSHVQGWLLSINQSQGHQRKPPSDVQFGGHQRQPRSFVHGTSSATYRSWVPSTVQFSEVGAPAPSIGQALSPVGSVLQDERTQYSSKILFSAAEIGNTRFVIELLQFYPDLIQKRNHDNQTIFHIAVMNRHQGIYNLLHEIGAMKDMITPLKDREGNNMLHLVGKTLRRVKLKTSGASLLMQRELLWFKEIEMMMPPFFRARKNKKGQTPYELFAEQNEDLVSQGLKWMKDCMVVATLIVTVAFAVAFTVPGGYKQEIGIPIFIHRSSFLVFAIADAISLFSSSTSLIVFLSILTSRHGQHDFLHSLPRKLMIGLMTLFISIAAMMITFSASFFVLYDKKLKWVPILIATFAAMPVISFAILQFPLLKDIFRSMYDSRYLFKPKKRMLYNTTPRF